MNTLNTIGWLALRGSFAYVYLWAFYKNTKDAAARQWTYEHTGYLFTKLAEPWRRWLTLLFAVGGMAMMSIGGVSILLGLEGRIGALLVLIFTAGGVYSHKLECDVATATAQKIAPLIPDAAKADFSTVQWSAFAGNYSSGLKNWALCGVCAGIMCWGTGPLSISDWTFHRLLACFS